MTESNEDIAEKAREMLKVISVLMESELEAKLSRKFQVLMLDAEFGTVHAADLLIGGALTIGANFSYNQNPYIALNEFRRQVNSMLGESTKPQISSMSRVVYILNRVLDDENCGLQDVSDDQLKNLFINKGDLLCGAIDLFINFGRWITNTLDDDEAFQQ